MLLAFWKDHLVAIWRVECGGVGVEAGRPVKRFSVYMQDDSGLDYVVSVMEKS